MRENWFENGENFAFLSRPNTRFMFLLYLLLCIIKESNSTTNCIVSQSPCLIISPWFPSLLKLWLTQNTLAELHKQVCWYLGFALLLLKGSVKHKWFAAGVLSFSLSLKFCLDSCYFSELGFDLFSKKFRILCHSGLLSEMILSDLILSWFTQVKVRTMTFSLIHKLSTVRLCKITWQKPSTHPVLVVRRCWLDLSEHPKTSMFLKIGHDVRG